MSNAYDQTFITEPAPKDLSVSLTLAACPKSPAWGWRQSGARSPARRTAGAGVRGAPGGPARGWEGGAGRPGRFRVSALTSE